MWTLVLKFLVAIPVGRPVMVEYFMIDMGLMGTSLKRADEIPVVSDLVSGIRWSSEYVWSTDQPGQLAPKVQLAERRFGVVRACDVLTNGGHQAILRTRLVIEPTASAPPDAVYPRA
jgi:hypothetical protein